MKRMLIFFLLIAIGISACSKKEQTDLTQFAKPEDFVSAEKPNEETAMKLLFGKYGKKEETIWQADYLKDEKEVAKFAGKNQLSTSVELFETVKASDGEKLVLVTASNIKDNDCATCAPFVSCFVFAKKDNKWKLESKDYYLSEIGSYGACDKAKIAVLGSSGEFGLIFEGEDETEASYAIIYTYYKNSFTDAAHFITGNDDGGLDDQEWSFKSEYKFEQGKSGNWYDMVVTTTGNQYDSESSKMIDMNKTDRYTFSNGKYIK
jgi:hypothetical protein